MKRSLYLFILTLIPTCLLAQAPRGGKGGFSLSNLSKGSNKVPDSLLIADSTELKSKKVIAYRLTPLLGDSYMAPMDTSILNTANSTLVEGKGLAIGYLELRHVSSQNGRKHATLSLPMLTITISQHPKMPASMILKRLSPTLCTQRVEAVPTKKSNWSVH